MSAGGKRPGAGRPAGEAPRKDATVVVRLSAEQTRALDSLAVRLRSTRAGVMRSALDEMIARELGQG